MDENDLAPVLAKFKDHLVSKNVASEIAEKLCESVSASLQGKKLGTFGSRSNTPELPLTFFRFEKYYF